MTKLNQPNSGGKGKCRGTGILQLVNVEVGSHTYFVQLVKMIKYCIKKLEKCRSFIRLWAFCKIVAGSDFQDTSW